MIYNVLPFKELLIKYNIHMYLYIILLKNKWLFEGKLKTPGINFDIGKKFGYNCVIPIW